MAKLKSFCPGCWSPELCHFMDRCMEPPAPKPTDDGASKLPVSSTSAGAESASRNSDHE